MADPGPITAVAGSVTAIVLGILEYLRRRSNKRKKNTREVLAEKSVLAHQIESPVPPPPRPTLPTSPDLGPLATDTGQFAAVIAAVKSGEHDQVVANQAIAILQTELRARRAESDAIRKDLAQVTKDSFLMTHELREELRTVSREQSETNALIRALIKELERRPA